MAAKVGPDEYRCPDCGQTKPHRDFYHPPTKRNRTSHYCRVCHRKRQQNVRDIRRGSMRESTTEEAPRMAEITVTTKLPLTSGKDATLTLEDGVVEIRTPASFSMPKATLIDLQVAVEELWQGAGGEGSAPRGQQRLGEEDA